MKGAIFEEMRKTEERLSGKTNTRKSILKQERKKRGWSQKKLAEQMGITEATVSRWERGIVPYPSFYCGEKLEEVFEMSKEELGFVTILPEVATCTPPESKAQRQKPAYILPQNATPLIGREKESAEIYKLLRDPLVRLITLTGPGGVGKTCVAIQVTRKIHKDRSSNVCFVPLADMQDKDQMFQTIANDLGMRKSKKVPSIDQISDFIGNTSLLLVLDTLEHLIPCVAELRSQLEKLLHICSQLTIMVTSREALHLGMECEYPIALLPVPDSTSLLVIEVLRTYPSIALFIQRAQHRKPSFDLTGENARDIVELCNSLDGLPLAIELFASSITLFSPHELKECFMRQSYIPSRDPSIGPERHQSLENNVRWSYDQLNTHEQWFLRQFSVFVGGATLKTIEDVLATEDYSVQNILDCVCSLINKGLLNGNDYLNGQFTRITMLETTRVFASRYLQEKGEAEQISALHARHYLEMIEQAIPALKEEQQDAQLRILAGEQTNLRVALKWFIERNDTINALRFCDAFGKFCGLYGAWEEERSFLRVVLALPLIPEGRAIRARVLRRAGHLSYRLRDLNEAVVWLTESVAVSRDIGDKQNLAGALSCLGWVCYRQNKMEEAHIYLQESVEAARGSNDDWAVANTLESRGRYFFHQKDMAKAYSYLRDSMAIARNLQDKETAVRILMMMVKMEIEYGSVNLATEYAEESLSLAHELGTKPLVALALSTSGDAARHAGDYEKAKECFTISISLAKELHDESAVESRSLELVEIAFCQDDIQAIRAFLRENSRMFKRQYDSDAVENMRERCQRYIEEREKNDFPY